MEYRNIYKSKVLNTIPKTYQLKDSTNKVILGCFYEPKLKKTDFLNTFIIELIIKKNKNKIYVKWLGFDTKHNWWINLNDISN